MWVFTYFFSTSWDWLRGGGRRHGEARPHPGKEQHQGRAKRPRDHQRREHNVAAAQEVGPALFYSLLIITLSFLPVFTLQAQEGRLFRPLAYTKTFAA